MQGKDCGQMAWCLTSSTMGQTLDITKKTLWKRWTSLIKRQFTICYPKSYLDMKDRLFHIALGKNLMNANHFVRTKSLGQCCRRLHQHSRENRCWQILHPHQNDGVSQMLLSRGMSISKGARSQSGIRLHRKRHHPTWVHARSGILAWTKQVSMLRMLHQWFNTTLCARFAMRRPLIFLLIHMVVWSNGSKVCKAAIARAPRCDQPASLVLMRKKHKPTKSNID